jgi:hypothetical protein
MNIHDDSQRKAVAFFIVIGFIFILFIAFKFSGSTDPPPPVEHPVVTDPDAKPYVPERQQTGATTYVSPPPIANQSPKTVDDDFKGIEIYTDSQLTVENYLVSPGSAEFPVYDKSMISQLNDTTFTIHSYVDSQNKMGGLMRNFYSCKIITHPSSKTYDCLDLKTRQQ